MLQLTKSSLLVDLTQPGVTPEKKASETTENSNSKRLQIKHCNMHNTAVITMSVVLHLT